MPVVEMLKYYCIYLCRKIHTTYITKGSSERKATPKKNKGNDIAPFVVKHEQAHDAATPRSGSRSCGSPWRAGPLN